MVIGSIKRSRCVGHTYSLLQLIRI
uniref:Uncharacterized protein n=1 Tax=Anguilla anguilla TaxID=7936 RepID=A0A0E9PXU8_ANGAN